MQYHDRIYGVINIEDAVLLELISTDAVQRLAGVLQHGITGLLGITRPTTRYEHSLGVLVLVKRFRGGLEEQIAALLHDVSHTAFSHVIDYVYRDYDNQTFHERKKGEYLQKTQIPVVLKVHGYDWRNFLDEDRYTLLEQPDPGLCADRLDYFLRDSLDLGLGAQKHIDQCLEHLVTRDGRVVVNDLKVARWMAYTFIAADETSWANFREVGLYELTAQALRYGLKRGIIFEEDIWSTDEALWHKLNSTVDAELQAILDLISVGTEFESDEMEPDFKVSTKLRTLDPPVLLDGNVLLLSEIDREFANFQAEYLTRKSGKWSMKVIGQ